MSAPFKVVFTLDECEVNVSIKDKFKITVEDCIGVIEVAAVTGDLIATNPDNGIDPVLIRLSNRRFEVPEGIFVSDETELHIDGGYERNYDDVTEASLGIIETGFDVATVATVSLKYRAPI